MKKLTVILIIVLAVCVCAAVLVTVWINKGGEPVTEPATTAESTTLQSSAENSSSETVPEHTTVKEETSKLDITYETTTAFEAKSVTRNFKNQTDRFKLYKQIVEATFNTEVTDIFFYDITHDGLADMITVTPLYNDETGKPVGRIIQLFTVTKENTVTEIFRDFGGVSTSGNGISCYVTEHEGMDCLLISKDELEGSTGKLSYSVFYVREDAKVITKASGQYSQKEDMDYDSEIAFNNYSAQAEAQINAAHTVLFDYHHPKAVSSKIDTAFDEYL